MDQDKSFYCVVDGTVQLFAHTGNVTEELRGGSWDEEHMNGASILSRSLVVTEEQPKVHVTVGVPRNPSMAEKRHACPRTITDASDRD